MKRIKLLISTAMSLIISLSLLNVSRAKEVPNGLLPALIQSMKDEMPVDYDIQTKDKKRLVANNPAQQLRFEFTPKGVEVYSGGEARLNMQLQSYSFDGRQFSLKPVLPTSTGAQIEYQYDGVTEWYINSPYGLEQGFTFEAPLEQKSRKLGLIFSIEGEVEQKGKRLVFTTDGRREIRYKGLQAFDSDGRFLASNLYLKGKQLLIEVNVEGAAYPVTIDPLFTKETKITASDAATGDQFGVSVAIDEDTAVVGAQSDDDKGNASGSAYVFIRSGGTWIEQQKLTASDGAALDTFGYSVAISGDTAVIGAHQYFSLGSGAAYVFVRSGNTWSEQQKLTASDGVVRDQFGMSVGISDDTIVVGAEGDGSAYVFVRNGNTWSEQQKLTTSDGSSVGHAVAISDETVVVGADSYIAPPVYGAAYVFERSGSVWSEQQKLTASDAAYYDAFGESVAISLDTIVIGAPEYGSSRPGGAYVFVRSGSTWSEQQKLTASDGALDDYFGESVAISEDTAVIGAFSDDDNGSDSGSAYVFVRSGSNWSEHRKITASDGAADDGFGWFVSISGDTAIIAADGDDDDGSLSGSAYIYEENVALPFLFLLD